MRDSVKIIVYDRDERISSNYIQQPTPDILLPFTWFKLGPTREIKIMKQGANLCIEYNNGLSWKLITGLIAVKGFRNIFFGDIQKQTIGLWIQSDQKVIIIALFTNHKTKSKRAKEKKVTQYINEQKKFKDEMVFSGTSCLSLNN